MPDNLIRERFISHLNTSFRVERGIDSTIVELVEVGDLRSSPHHEAFSLVFRGLFDAFLPQAVYRFHHDSLDPFEPFIVPIGQDKNGLYYEAIFSRLRSTEQE